MPVRDGEDSIRRCLDSILAQRFSDFEIIVCDNASTDRTAEILREYAARDARVRVFWNEENIGLIANFNRVFELSRGEYFRWVGADDWLEPAYASECVAALDEDPGAIAVTTYFGLHHDQGHSQFEEHQGEFPESERPERRLARMLWFFHADPGLYEPIYSLIRRDSLARTGRIRMMESNDWMLAAELSLCGRLRHLRKRLFHRSRGTGHMNNRQRALSRLHPSRQRELVSPVSRLLRVLISIIRIAPLSPTQRTCCYLVATHFCAQEARRRVILRFHRFRRQRLGLTRDRVRAWGGQNKQA